MDTYMVKVRLTPENIDDIMSAVLSSGRINRWCKKVVPVGECHGGSLGKHISRGGTLAFHDAATTDIWMLNRDRFLNGVKKYLEEGLPFAKTDDGCIDTKNISPIVSDVIVQLALFGQAS